MSRRRPFILLILARLRELVREPELIFWIFIFPILLAMGLGIAFRDKPPDEIVVGVVQTDGSDGILAALSQAHGFRVETFAPAIARQRLRLGKVSLVVMPGHPCEFVYDPARPDSFLARQMTHDVLERAAGRTDLMEIRETLVTEPGARYIDFLIPGLLGMNIMSGGMWGVGFLLVEMRSRNLLKRLIATPMRRADFLGAIMTSRMLLVLGEMVLLLVFGWLVFHLVIQGSLLTIALLAGLGAFVFAGLGMLVGSRTAKIESASGLTNLVMLPMFVCSGIFFSSDRFPAVLQPWLRALPLTALNDALRDAILEGSSLSSQWMRILVLLAWGVVSFVVALRIFRWN